MKLKAIYCALVLTQVTACGGGSETSSNNNSSGGSSNPPVTTNPPVTKDMTVTSSVESITLGENEEVTFTLTAHDETGTLSADLTQYAGIGNVSSTISGSTISVTHSLPEMVNSTSEGIPITVKDSDDEVELSIPVSAINTSGEITLSKVNTGKTVFSSRAHNRHVTGITISNEGKLSLGRDRKRKISSLVHKFGLGLLNAREINELRGLLAFASDIEPLFLARLRGKYGSECLSSIRNYKYV